MLLLSKFDRDTEVLDLARTTLNDEVKPDVSKSIYFN